MDKQSFINILSSNGYEVASDGGAVIAICKDKPIEEGIEHIKGLVLECGYNSSWGIRGVSAGKVRQDTPTHTPAAKTDTYTTHTDIDITIRKDNPTPVPSADIIKPVIQKTPKEEKKEIKKEVNKKKSNMDNSFSQMSLFDLM